MRHIPKIASEYLRRYRRYKLWQRIVAAVASVVVFCTTYALILPAITISIDEADEYGIKTGQTDAEAAALGVVHVHTEACYETRQVLDCPFEVHQHTAACYEDEDEDGARLCGYADFVVHTHDAYCYDADGTLVCTLSDEYPEEHTHDASCYAEAAASESEIETTKTDETLQTAQTTPEDEEAKDADEAKGADNAEDEDEADDSEKYEAFEQDEDAAVQPEQSKPELADNMADLADATEPEEQGGSDESGLNLTTLAYDFADVAENTADTGNVDDAENGLIEESELGEEPDALAATAAPLCGKKEVALHTHTDEPDIDGNSCRNTADELVCGKIEVLAHQHDENCLREEPVLVCGYAANAANADESDASAESAAAIGDESAEEESTAGTGPRRAGAKRAAEVTACEHVYSEDSVCTVCGLTKEEIEAEAGAETITPCEEHAYGEDGVCTVCGLKDSLQEVTVRDEDGFFSAAITVSGTMPEAAEVTAKIAEDEDCYITEIQAELGDAIAPAFAYDITILNDGDAWQPSEPMEVTIKLKGSKTWNFGNCAVRVLHIDTTNDNAVEPISDVAVTETTETDETTEAETTYTLVTFKAESFSPYVVAVDASVTDDGGDDDGNGDESSTYASTTFDNTWIELTNSYINQKNGVLSAGKYYLNGNLSIEKNYYHLYDNGNRGVWCAIYIEDNAEVVIDLNGYVLEGYGGVNYYSQFDKWWSGYTDARTVIAENTGKLIIQDSNATRTHYGTVDDKFLWTWDKNAEDTAPSADEVPIQGGIITGGKGADGTGGGIYVYQGTLILNGGTVAGNQASGSGDSGYAGGGIRCGGNSVQNATLDFYMNDGARVCYNYSQINGGGLYLQGNVTIEGGSIDHNYAEKYGGGLRITSQYDTAFTMTGGTISYNKANQDGGGVEISMGHPAKTPQKYATKAVTVNFDGGEITNNYAKGNGGGFNMSEYPGKAVYLTIDKETTVTGNTAGGNGGGVYLEYGTFTMNNGLIQNNKATQNGGGVYVTNADSGTTVQANILGGTIGGASAEDANKAQNGGGIYVDGGDVTISGGTVSHNEATQNGGGAYVDGGDVTMSGGTAESTPSAASDEADDEIGGAGDSTGRANNAAVEGAVSYNTAVDGGGVYVNSGDVTMSDGVVSCNTASNDGGGIYVNGGNVMMEGGEIDSNKAAQNGGGIAVSGTNTKLVQVTASLSSSANSSDTDGITVSNNEATNGNGGGIYVNCGIVDLNAATITGNSACNWTTLDSLGSGNGGGVYVKNGSLTLDGGTVAENTCSRFGGGLYLYADDGSLTADAKAQITTDGVASSTTPFVLTGGDIEGNKAGQCGGGVAIYKSTVEFANTYSTGGTGVHIENNTAVNGGGLYLRWGSKLTMNGGYVKYNTAVALDSTGYDKFFTDIVSKTSAGTSLSNTSIVQHADGDTGGNGGGIFIHNSELDLTATANVTYSGDIAYNTADRNGGGVYALHSEDTNSADGTDAKSTAALNLKLADGNIENNTAGQFGGGIAMFASNECTKEKDSSHEHALATIEGDVQVNTNTATNGGGFYVGGGQLTVTGGIVKMNEAQGEPDETVTTAINPDDNIGVGGGLYVYDTGTLVLDIKTDETKNETNLGVYSNRADFAADDVYCGPKTTSQIYLPKAKEMNLLDYQGNVIGYAINWFEDYPNGDTDYKDERRATPQNSTTYKAATKVVRYRDATDSEKVAFDITSDTTEEVYGYLCLTLGYKYTRVNLTIEKQMPGTDTNSGQEFNFKATITRPKKSNGEAALDTDERLIFAWDTTSASAQGVKYTVADTKLGAGADEVIVEFTLQAGQSVTLEGIPAYASVEIEELKTDAQPGTATSGSLYTPLYTWDGENPTGNDVRTLTQEGMIAKLNSVGNETYYTVTCTNLASGAQLPQTGGAGTQRYILCGLVLLLAACGTAGSQSRRKHRAGKGAGAR